MSLKSLLAFLASVVALLVAPVAANACASLARVQGFDGGAHMAFSNSASGDNGSGGTETISLNRTASNLKVDLTRRVPSRLPGYVVFLGKVTGGDVSVHDSFDSGAGATGELTHKGYTQPGFAVLSISTRACRYTLQLSFGVHASFSGNAQEPSGGVTGSAYTGDRNIPGSLKLAGAPVPDAFYNNCEVKLVGLGGRPCYAFGGGWSTDFITLFQCHSVTAVSCSSSDRVGTALFSWDLKPRFK